MYEYRKSVEKGRLLPNHIAFLFWVFFLGLPLPLLLFQQPTLQLKHVLQRVEVEQDV